MKFKIGLILWGVAFLAAENRASAMPAQVVIIRHGEKPAEGNGLNARGFQRAAALPQFFQNNPTVTAFGPAAAIYAMKPGSADGSIRAIQTVTPLANVLGLTIHQSFTKNDIQSLVDEIENTREYDGHLVVICWEHKVIPQIAEAFGLQNGPASWGGGSVFDRAWVLNFTGNQVSSFKDIGEALLPGDSPSTALDDSVESAMSSP